MFVGLVEAEALVAQVAAGVDPAGCTPGEAAAALARFSAIERFAGGARLLLAARAAESGEWRRAGFRSAAHWLARQLGVTIFDARRILGASGALDDLPDTAEAIRQGKLSDGEAEEVADTATKAPGSEKELLDKAAEGDTTKLKAIAGAVGPRRRATKPPDARRSGRGGACGSSTTTTAPPTWPAKACPRWWPRSKPTSARSSIRPTTRPDVTGAASPSTPTPSTRW
jgi:hypothetical protein